MVVRRAVVLIAVVVLVVVVVVAMVVVVVVVVVGFGTSAHTVSKAKKILERAESGWFFFFQYLLIFNVFTHPPISIKAIGHIIKLQINFNWPLKNLGPCTPGSIAPPPNFEGALNSITRSRIVIVLYSERIVENIT